MAGVKVFFPDDLKEMRGEKREYVILTFLQSRPKKIESKFSINVNHFVPRSVRVPENVIFHFLQDWCFLV